MIRHALCPKKLQARLQIRNLMRKEFDNGLEAPDLANDVQHAARFPQGTHVRNRSCIANQDHKASDLQNNLE